MAQLLLFNLNKRLEKYKLRTKDRILSQNHKKVEYEGDSIFSQVH